MRRPTAAPVPRRRATPASRSLPTTEQLRTFMLAWLGRHPAPPSPPERLAEEWRELHARAVAIRRQGLPPDDPMRRWAEQFLQRHRVLHPHPHPHKETAHVEPA